MSSKVKSCELVFEFVILIYPAAKCSLIQVMALLKAALINPILFLHGCHFVFSTCAKQLHFARVQFIFFISRLIYLIEKLKREHIETLHIKDITMCIKPAGPSFNEWSLVFLSSRISVYDCF